jgi:hypothetical protein
MVYRFFIALLWCFFCISGQEEIFLKANELYRQKQYMHAVVLYNSINNKGPAVWHNVGNCCWYVKQYKDAFIAYNKALKNASLADIHFLENKKKESYKHWTGHELIGKSWKERVVAQTALFTLLQWQIICIILWSIGIVSLYRWRNKKWYKKYVILCVFVLLGIFFIMRCAYTNDQLQGLIVTNTKLFIAPRNDVYAIKELLPADRIVIINAHTEWVKVKAQGVVGWIPSTDYEIL